MGKPVSNAFEVWGVYFPTLLKWAFLIAVLGLAVSGCGGARRAPIGTDLSTYPWVYLREGRALQEGERVASILAVGDVMLGRGVIDEPDPLGTAAPLLHAADLALGNLECAIAPPGAPLPSGSGSENPGQPYLLVAPFNAAEQLSRAGFNLLGLANNHALDRGLEGLGETGAALENVGILPVGAAEDPIQAYKAVVQPVGDLQLAFLAFNAVPSPRGPEWSGEVRQSAPDSGWSLAGWDRERAIAAVQSASTQADGVIVSIHWGYEYETRVDPAQRQMARELVAAGADLVIGHHPHVVQAIERLPRPDGNGEALAAYSLGNFVFDQGFDQTGQGLALLIYYDRQGLRAVQALPVFAGKRPSLMTPGQAEALYKRLGLFNSASLTPEETTLAWRCDQNTCSPVATPSGRGEGIFTQGESDLNGDGTPEQVKLYAGRVHIEGSGLPDWDSPPEWQVADLAAGDPNRDGRQELLLALKKPDRSGVLLSHPFILGYRDGDWRLLWGGSAVSDPIQEVALGDLDGDGLQELIVLEALHSGMGQAVSVWRWHGWGFSQVWRSAPARSRNLRLVKGETGLIVVAERTVPLSITPQLSPEP